MQVMRPLLMNGVDALDRVVAESARACLQLLLQSAGTENTLILVVNVLAGNILTFTNVSL